MTDRDKVEEFLLKELAHVSPFNPDKDYQKVNRYKNGNFGVSSLAFSLYSNGNNPRGSSSFHKYGLIYEDGNSIFSISFFKKKEDDKDGYLFIVAPTGSGIVDKVSVFIKRVFSNKELPIRGAYLRYLDLNLYIELIKKGYLPAKEYPFCSESPEEDETFNNCLVRIDDVVVLDGKEKKVNKIHLLEGDSSKKVKYAYARFRNFLQRNNIKYRLESLTNKNSAQALDVITSHFDMLTRQGKRAGSSIEDHVNSISSKILKNGACIGFLGFLGKFPVSVFVGESISSDTFALYTPFTLRDESILNNLTGGVWNADERIGLSAMPTFAYVELFSLLKQKGYDYVNLGGSEFSDLNKFKRQLGGALKPTYWVYQSRALHTKSNTAAVLL